MIRLAMALSVLALAVGPVMAITVIDTGGFEGYAQGDLPGQDGWIDDTTDPAYGMVQVVADPTGAGMGNVIVLDPPGTTAGTWLGAARPAGPTTLPIVTIEWDQYRTGITDNLWVADAVDFGGWWAIQWDQSGGASAQGFDFGPPVSPNIWQHVTYTLDTANQTATVDIAGVGSFTSPNPMTDTAIDGIVFELEPTESGGEDGPMYIDNVVITQTPEPASLVMLLAGGLVVLRRRA